MDDDSTLREHPVHPCICGYVCDKYSQMKHHRAQCEDWKNRPNPMNMMIDRRRQTRRDRSIDVRHFEPCAVCHRRPDHHDSACPNSQAEVVRRESLKKHGIDPILFEIFLRVLARKYEGMK